MSSKFKEIVGKAYNDYLKKGFGSHPPSEALWLANEYVEDNKGQPITEEGLYNAVYEGLVGTDF